MLIFFLQFYLFIWLRWVFFFFFCYAGFSLVVVSRGYSLIAVRGLLIAATSLALWSIACRAFRPQYLQRTGSVAVGPGLQNTGSVAMA